MPSPAFQLYVNDFLGSAKVGMMDADEVGAYVLLLCLDWQEEGFVFNEKRLAKWCRLSLGRFRKAWQIIGECFIEVEGRLYNPRLQKEREKQAEWRKKSAQGAATANAKRWGKGQGGDQGGDEMATAEVSPNGRIPSPSPFPTPVTTDVDDPRGCNAIELATFCNAAITERWGESLTPITHGSCQQLADDLAGIHWETVRDAIAVQCRASKSDKPPRSANYFRNGILQYRDQLAAAAAAKAHGSLPRVIPIASADSFLAGLNKIANA